MLNFETNNHLNKKNIAKTARIAGIGIGITLSSPAFSQSAHDIEGSFAQDKIMENIALTPLRQPEDYDVSKTAKIDLTDLENKKNLDPRTIKKMALEVVIKEKTLRIYDKQYRAFLAKDQAEIEGNKEKMSTCENIINSCAQEMTTLKNQLSSLPDKNCDDLSLNFDEKDSAYLEMIPKMIVELEKGRRHTLTIIDSPEYLSKLQIEFDCSLDEAKRHQQVRLNNVNASNYFLTSNRETSDIFKKENPESAEFKEIWCYDAKYDNIIYVNYEVDLLEYLREVALHEFMHKATRRNLGMSPKAIELLRRSFTESEDMSDVNRIYESIPTERYVRLKILELMLEEMGIKKISEKFTRKHFNEMILLWKYNKLNKFSASFIFNTLPTTNLDELYKIYDELFNEIADNSSGKTYYHPGWDYTQNIEQNNHS